MPFFALALALLLSRVSPAASCTVQEKASLLLFLSGLSQDGALATSWRNVTSCCTWEGITCNVNGAVSEVSLGYRELEGKIPPSLGDLGSLLRLNLSGNSFAGTLPPELISSGSIVILDASDNRLNGALQDLSSSASDLPMRLLNISSNQFTGELPSTMWVKMRSLVVLNASNNSFTGQMPSSFCISSQSLEVLDLSYNQLSGHVPNQLGNCSALRVLKAGQNNLTGALPDELFNATLLEHLSFHNNDLEGTILGEHVIKLRNMAILNLGRNRFSGTIPASIGHLRRLEELHLNRNDMSGELPPAIGNCTNLRVINLRSNRFGGMLQKVNFSTLSNLKFLDLLFNNFSGEIPENIYSCSKLIGLRLSSNKFNGQLSPRIGNLKSLVFLSIAENYFVNITGFLHRLKNSRNLTVLLMGTNFMDEVMPDHVTTDGFENLQMLTIDNCQLSGKLPLWLSKLSSLRILDLSNNQLTGTIPVWIKSLNFLYYIDMSNNSLLGEIPTALMEITMLQSKKVPDYLNQRVSSVPIYMSAPSAYRMPVPVPREKIMKPMRHSSCNNTSSSRLAMLLFVPALVMLISMASLAISCTEQEKSSLLQFVAELSQDDGLAASWQNATDCCKWEGIACNSDRSVIGVFLASRSLQGHISTTLGNLTALQHLNLSHNSLSGYLPHELVSSSSLVVLDVSFNQLSGQLQELRSSVSDLPIQVLNISSNLFSGEFPSTIWGPMKNLVVLNASNNSFTGHMPTHFCINSPSFMVLDLSYNKFSESIPPVLGSCSMLRVLKVGHNNLNGVLPNELFDATSLEFLSFPNNDVQGILDDAHIARLRNLVILDLGKNKLNGKIPDSIGQLKRLQEIHLDYNNISGELPSTLSDCTNLVTINLKSNNLSGELAKVNFSTLHNLKTLDLLYNNFTGTIPESIYSCRNLVALRLSGNNLGGQLSPRIDNLKSLTFLSLGQNNFTNITNTLHILKSSKNLTTLLIGFTFMHETMPDDESIDGFENLQVLSLSGCSLLGQIPHWLSKLTNLELLLLNNNQLTGTIPDWISTLNFLFYLDISNNSLTGEIPTALTEMPMLKSEKNAAPLDPRVFELPIYVDISLQYRMVNAFPKVLNLGNNDLTGMIPPEIGLLKELLSLNVSSNKLYGDIPQYICKLTNLLVLDLSRNHLTGTIPSALNDLHFLSKFDVSFNDLEGPVPTTGQFSTFANSSFTGNPKLCGPMLNHNCSSVEAVPVSIIDEKLCGIKVIFTISFGVFFGVGVLYDQIVVSRYFG
ncbi:unnamed protein product [Urochloa decumbens]|uniref:Leucine-rich repeat-containing N-terminal plant-type domain-containing protein n=1 Tax=Urochloa decumbens TaxID=240449 RepID=A0ABC9EMP2_9POAL